MRDRAAHRAAVARRHVPDVGQREPQQRAGGAAPPACRSSVALRAQRADAHGTVGDVDHRERRHLAEVDEHCRRSEPEVEQRHEALTAGDDLGVVAVLGQ